MNLMSTQETLKRTPLYEAHFQLKAKMVPFGGWEMPVQYDGILAEYEETRRRVTMFDISHMGEFFVDGEAVHSGLDRIVTPAIQRMPEKACRYGVMLNDQGGVIDDLVIFRIAAQRWMIVVNAATAPKDADWFRGHMTMPKTFHDRSPEIGKLDIQGPQSRKILSPLVENIEKLDYYTFDEFDVLGQKVIVSRTGYTGDLGYEIYYPWEKTKQLWDELLRLGVKPAGLGARDILRLEMGYSLYGHELAEDISPLESGLDRFIDWDKDFIGRPVLRQQKEKGIRRKIVSFISQSRRSPRSGQHLYSAEGHAIGDVTSGTYSPYVEKGIGLGFVPVEYKTGDEIFFGDDKLRSNAKIVKRPIYDQGSLKN